MPIWAGLGHDPMNLEASGNLVVSHVGYPSGRLGIWWRLGPDLLQVSHEALTKLDFGAAAENLDRRTKGPYCVPDLFGRVTYWRSSQPQYDRSSMPPDHGRESAVGCIRADDLEDDNEIRSPNTLIFTEGLWPSSPSYAQRGTARGAGQPQGLVPPGNRGLCRSRPRPASTRTPAVWR